MLGRMASKQSHLYSVLGIMPSAILQAFVPVCNGILEPSGSATEWSMPSSTASTCSVQTRSRIYTPYNAGWCHCAFKTHLGYLTDGLRTTLITVLHRYRVLRTHGMPRSFLLRSTPNIVQNSVPLLNKVDGREIPHTPHARTEYAPCREIWSPYEIKTFLLVLPYSHAFRFLCHKSYHVLLI